MAQRGPAYVRGRLFRRARKLYEHHAILLMIMFTAEATAVGLFGNRPLHNHRKVC